jgi:hypothetical protein
MPRTAADSVPVFWRPAVACAPVPDARFAVGPTKAPVIGRLPTPTTGHDLAVNWCWPALTRTIRASAGRSATSATRTRPPGSSRAVGPLGRQHV